MEALSATIPIGCDNVGWSSFPLSWGYTVSLVEMPPVGFYLAREAGRLAGVSGDQIGQWARRGYIRSSQSLGPPRVYSYQDVAEAMVVHELRSWNVRLAAIKAAIDFLRDEMGTGWPLTAAVSEHVLLVPKRAGSYTILPGTEGIPRWGVSLQKPISQKPRNLVVSSSEFPTDAEVLPVDLHQIASNLERGGWAVRDIPDLTHIEVDPDRLSGRPVIRGSRVAAEFVAAMGETEEGRTLLREDYGLTDEEINDAVRWWSAVASYEKSA